ncbi:MAG: type II and III secretion system protein [Opitutaceae bacterium]|nr:type II and III secretion system protein [Verrucomicrobiales bacterium]
MIKPPAAVFSILGILALNPAYAGETTTTTRTTTTSVHGSADRELARRQEAMNRAEEAIAKGDQAMKEKDYEVAVAQYKFACDQVPESDATQRIRGRALDGFCDAACELAKQRISEGRYQDAETVLKLVTSEQYDPKCREAAVLLAQLEDPEYFNKTITPKFRASVEEVKKLMIEARGFYDTGRFDMAFRRYEQVLNLDPYNIAARKGQEQVNKARDDYAVQAYNHTRSHMIWQVDKAWDRPVRRFGLKEGGIYESQKGAIRDTAAIEAKLNRIIIPKVDFREATVRSAIDFLKQKSRDLDPEPDPSKQKGVNIVLKLESSASAVPITAPVAPVEVAIPGLETPAAPVAPVAPATPLINPSEARITLQLTNVPLMEVLRYITSLANLKIKIEPYAVAVVPASEPTDALYTKEYKVPPGFIGSVPGGGAAGGGGGLGGGGAAGAIAGDAKGTGANIARRAQAREFLEGQGVTFPPGATATYSPSSSRLVVRNTQTNLDLIDSLVDIGGENVPKQVEIESKFVEISQNNLKELSFDWLVGPFNIPGTDPGGNSPPGKILAGGGTGTIGAGDFPFSTGGLNSVTGNNRSGNLAIGSNAVDALLFPSGAAAGKTPGIFGLAGTLTDPQFQVVIRALNQKKGVDLLSAPRVTTKSGQRAVIEIIREFRYPTEFDPPQIPQTFGGGGSNSTGNQTIAVFPVTPTTPTAFETRNTGVTLEVEPTVGPDGYTIDLNLVPQVVEFEGFINYGSPIRTINPAALGLGGAAPVLGVPASVVLTDNTINQPIFSTRKVTTSVTIWDGQTVVIGGLMREDVQKVEDKTPFLGDLPFFGRLFRSSVDQHLKRNLIIFVSARLINPAGEAILQDEEKEEVVEALALPEIAPPALPEVPMFSK